jgi:mannan endo-1,4-beta-mannosidase
MNITPLRRLRRPALALLAMFVTILVALTGGNSLRLWFSEPTFRPSSRAAVISYLNSISGQYTIAGQHNREPNSDPAKFTRVAEQITGRYPGLWGGDFLFEATDVANRQRMIDEAIKQWRASSLVALTWHMCPPTAGPTCHWNDGADRIAGATLSDAQWSELITAGTPLNQAFKRRLDEAVPYLRQLQGAGVPALFRPLHEINNPWSWWNGRPGPAGSARLFQILHDYLVADKGLTNLVWVWSAEDNDLSTIEQYWPGPDYVDVAALDVWYHTAPQPADYRTMLRVAAGKPIALGEVGQVPSVATLQSQPRWTYFLVWAEYLTDPAYNTAAATRLTYLDARVLVRGEFSITGPFGAPARN